MRVPPRLVSVRRPAVVELERPVGTEDVLDRGRNGVRIQAEALLELRVSCERLDRGGQEAGGGLGSRGHEHDEHVPDLVRGHLPGLDALGEHAEQAGSVLCGAGECVLQVVLDVARELQRGVGGPGHPVQVGHAVEQGPGVRHAPDDARAVLRWQPDQLADGPDGDGVAEGGHGVGAGSGQEGGELLAHDARDHRLQGGDGGGAEVGLEQLAVPRVQRRVGRGQDVDRIAEASHAERDRTAMAVVVQEAHEVGREVLGTPDRLPDEPRVRDEVGVLAWDLPDGGVRPQRVVELARICQDVVAQEQRRVAQVQVHGGPVTQRGSVPRPGWRVLVMSAPGPW